MAAYAALASLMNNMDQIKNHRRLWSSLDESQIESLGEKVGFFLDYLESYNCHGGSKEAAEELESQIAAVAHEAEDVIESHIVYQIENGSSRRSHRRLFQLQKVIADMCGIKEKVMEVKEKWGFEEEQPSYSIPAIPSRPLSTRNATPVGFDDESIQLMDVLSGQQSDRQIISIVGMGGIGKTTLARNVYENSLIVQHFDLRAWTTISQEYSVRNILLQLLSCLGKSPSGTVDERDDELGEYLYKSLSGRRYLIILDDMWGIDIWDKINFFFPDNGHGSRVVLTTRLSNVATHCGCSCLRMNFLDEDKSWNLYCEKVFGNEDCPPELERYGKEIARLCRGLPLSISVIGGLLQKSQRTCGYWHSVAKNINSILNSGENEQCFNILSLSYSHLPAHLKPCFLYTGVFKEDYEIGVSDITKLWVAEGFLRPNGDQILEEIAEGYLKDLIDRNLILVGGYRKNGNIKTCRVHDLLRDLCIRVAEKEKFFCVVRVYSVPQAFERERRLICHDTINVATVQVLKALESASLARVLIWENCVKPPSTYKLMRVWNTPEGCPQNNFNLRHLHCYTWPSHMSLIWNLQTLVITGGLLGRTVVPIEIWKMPQLRHLECDDIYLPGPPSSNQQGDDLICLRNLQTLKRVVDFKWNEEACKRIPNIKKLHIDFWEGHDDDGLYYNLSNLGCLHKLESLRMELFYDALQYRRHTRIPLSFPSSLNKLSLRNWHLHWEDLRMIASLPQLEVLNLERSFATEREWVPIDAEFRRLKFLKLHRCHLRSWTTAEGSYFPVLEKLVLQSMDELDEIPWGIGDTPTLRLIRLEYCTDSAVISALRIKEEQESLGNDGLQIQVVIQDKGGYTT